MKYWLSYTFTVLLAGIFLSLVIIFFAPILFKGPAYVAPIPDSFIYQKNNQVTLLDIWLPLFETFAQTSSHPPIQAKSVLLYDLTANKVLVEKDAKIQLPMASLTKIMTAIIALEDQNMPQKYYVSGEDLVGEDSMGLTAGEVLSKEELLYGLLMSSGNDAAEVLAHNYPGGREAFITAMHNKLAALGLKDTSFSNVSGLQGDGVQYTTTYDLLVMTKYALENFPLFREIVATYQHDIPQTAGHKAYNLVNETNLISTYAGVKGVKTGYTPEAGMCLVTYYENDTVKLVGILLNSPDRRGEMRTLLNYALPLYNITPPDTKTL